MSTSDKEGRMDHSSELVGVGLDYLELEYGVSRTRYMELRLLLSSPRRLSQRVRTEDLANVVNGRTDVALPSWASNAAFEREIEDRIAESKTVWICTLCDSIVGFFSDPVTEADKLVPQLLLVSRREGTRCLYCNGDSMLLARPAALTRGVKIAPPAVKRADTPGSTRPSPVNDGANWRFLESELARTAHGVDTELLSHYGRLESLKERVGDAFSRWRAAGDVSERVRTPTRPLQDHLEYGMPLKPIWTPKGNNVLGRVWDSVRSIAAHQDPALGEIAVAVAKRRGFSAQSHFGPNGERAITVDFGVFDRLYRVNHLMNLLHFAADKRWSPEVIGESVLEELCPDSMIHPKQTIPKGYETENDFWRAHILTNCQQQFILLHEVGHFVPEVSDSRSGRGRAPSTAERLLLEKRVDGWALEQILGYGDEFYDPALQLRAMSWLFEYWHLLQALTPNAAQGEARARWDSLLSTLQGLGLPCDSLSVLPVRTLFDGLLERLPGRSP